jgi:hypothetical protein
MSDYKHIPWQRLTINCHFSQERRRAVATHGRRPDRTERSLEMEPAVRTSSDALSRSDRRVAGRDRRVACATRREDGRRSGVRAKGLAKGGYRADRNRDVPRWKYPTESVRRRSGLLAMEPAVRTSSDALSRSDRRVAGRDRRVACATRPAAVLPVRRRSGLAEMDAVRVMGGNQPAQ